MRFFNFTRSQQDGRMHIHPAQTILTRSCQMEKLNTLQLSLQHFLCRSCCRSLQNFFAFVSSFFCSSFLLEIYLSLFLNPSSNRWIRLAAEVSTSCSLCSAVLEKRTLLRDQSTDTKYLFAHLIKSKR